MKRACGSRKRRWGRQASRLILGALTAVLGLMGGVGTGDAQQLADFDYENLTFRGLGVEWGYLYPTRVEETQSVGIRADLGYLGPGVRIVPSVHFWESRFVAGEVEELEASVASLIGQQIDGPVPPVDLGRITWKDLVTTVDAQVVWRVPFGVLTHVGVGGSVHVLDGSGAAIDGTFVEDLLDSVTPGVNVHMGLEYLLKRRLRVMGQGRYEVLGDLQYFQVRIGGQVMVGPNHPGEVGESSGPGGS